jgi:hypothetical protein
MLGYAWIRLDTPGYVWICDMCYVLMFLGNGMVHFKVWSRGSAEVMSIPCFACQEGTGG